MVDQSLQTFPLSDRGGDEASACLLSSSYFPPVQWMQKLHRYRRVFERGDGPKCLMRDVRISDHGEWRHLHWNAIVSAYGESPFFLYYADDLRPFFERRWDFLFDFNMEITMKLCELLDVRPSIEPTDDYASADVLGARLSSESGSDVRVDDYRDVIRPKHPLPDASFTPRPYYQVHALRQGFQPNMSALDLLMNEGPEGIFWL